MKFSDKTPFIVKDEKDQQLVELRREFEKFLKGRSEVTRGTGVDSEKYLRLLRPKKPKK